MTNPARGEAEIKLGEYTFVMVATMEGLADLSTAIRCDSIAELYKRLVHAELRAVLSGLRAFVDRGERADGTKMKRNEAAALAVSSFMLSDIDTVAAAFANILAAFLRPAPSMELDSGNASSTGQA